MGCFLSSISDNAEIYNKIPQLREWMREFRALALTEKAVEKFWKIYRKIDIDGSGSIEIKEMLVHFDVDRTKFTKRVFGIFDEDESGFIDLREFILALWNYCTLGKATLVIFAFDLYDKDGSGIIDSQEIALMLKEVYGKAYDKNVYAVRILETISGMEVDAVDIDKFRKFVKKHPALLFPAFEMQRKMQKHTLGVSYWRRLGDKRLKLSSGQFVPIKKFMEMHLEKLATEDKNKARFSTKNISKNAAVSSVASGQGSKERSSTADRVSTRDRTSVRKTSITEELSSQEARSDAQIMQDALTEADKATTTERASMKPRRRSIADGSSLRSAESRPNAGGGVPFEVGPTVDPGNPAPKQRRGSTMGSALPSQIPQHKPTSENTAGGQDHTNPSSTDVYDVLVNAAKESGGTDVKKRSFKQIAVGVKTAAKYAAPVNKASVGPTG